MKNFIPLLLGVCTVLSLKAQITLIPDSNFEQQLINKGIDSDNTINGQVATADIENITVLSVSDAGIQDMTGIQDFVSLEMLFCALNDITEINIATLTNLTALDVGVNNLSNVDISANINLISFACTYNNLTTLDISNNLALEFLLIGQTEDQIIPRNVISNLDLSNNSNIDRLRVSFLNLDALNLMNGNNFILTGSVEIEGNPLLECILVDDPVAANNGELPYSEWEIDPGTGYANGPDCTLGIVNVTPKELALYPNPATEYIFYDIGHERPKKLAVYNALGSLVKTYTNRIPSYIVLSEFPNGVYFLKMETETNLYASRFIKE